MMGRRLQAASAVAAAAAVSAGTVSNGACGLLRS